MSEITKIAVLDVDGTLLPGALGVELLQVLMRRQLCDLNAARRVLETLASFRVGEIDFETMATQAYADFALALAGRSCERVESVARELWTERRAALFGFVPRLLELLRGQGYHTMLISGSPIEMVALVAETLDIPEAHGALFCRSEGRYEGRVELSSGMPGRKAEIFAAATASRQLQHARCFAMGDTLTDVSLFERVGLPLAFEPSAELEELARARGWAIASRVDVVARARDLLDPELAPSLAS